ncbi:MAG: InlB B-repeat-containing protein [Lactimicrobium sp.]|uniref:InlB B-repeat-containing protein n=1 Tax=Lactimicrobium sp. TaxID=2563780 RepID=UPI002F35420C
MRSYSRKNKKGFTLGEMLITVAIVAILSAVAIISVTSYLWNVRLLDADQAAKEIYLAAQYHLSLAKERGTLDQYTGDKLGTVDTLYKDSAYINEKGGTLYDLVYSPGKDAAKVIDVILPQGSVDETMRTGGSYIITYDKDTATVVGVFYSYAGRNYGYSFTSNTLTNETAALKNAMPDKDSTDAKAVRKHFPDKKNRQTIGFYGGKDLAAGKTDAPVLSIENGDTLNAIVTLSEEQNNVLKREDADYEIQLTIKGNTSGNTFTKIVEKSSLKESNGDKPVYQYSTVLDAWQNHAYVNSEDNYALLQIDWQFYDKPNEKYITPGENITVTASVVRKEDDGSYSSVSKPSNSVTANSMFGSLKTVNGKYTVTISSIRHLENLAKIDTSELNIVNAVQVSDISFTQYQYNMSITFGGDQNLYIYTPVSLSNDLTYDAGYEYTDSNGQQSHRQYMISDLSVGTNKSTSGSGSTEGGVFGSLNSGKILTVSNLQIIDINTNSIDSEYGGALLGSADKGSTVMVNNVLVWDKSATIGINAESDAGGLIGHSDGTVNIKNTAVSAYVKSTGGNAGGLIGSASTLNVQASYVSGHTYQKDYVLETNAVTDKDNQHYNIIAKDSAGGIAGTVTTLNGVTNSYVTASVYGGTAHAFVGSVSDDSAITKAGSYAITTVNGNGVKEPSSFTGKGDTTTKYVNDESLLDGNEEVTYPYTVVSSLDTNAKAWFLKSHVGDWQGANKHETIASFNNDEILQFKASVPNVSSSDTVEIQFFYQGTFGLADVSQPFTIAFRIKDGKIIAEDQWTERDHPDQGRTDWSWKTELCKVETVGNVTNYTINIDDITYYKDGHLGDFRNVISSDSGKSPGYDVTARVLVNGTVVSDPVYTNSSFGTNTDATTAVISCGRHLQNMASDVPGRWEPKWQTANLTTDIHWDTDGNSFFDRVKKLRIDQSDEVTSVYLNSGTEIKDQKFYPINANVMMFSGTNTSFLGNGHTVYDITLDTSTSYVGLFGSVETLSNISDLTVENGLIQANGGVTNAGILAGRVVNNTTTISHCFVTGEKSLVRIGTPKKSAAGGLVGYFQGKEIISSGASAYVQGDDAGGLVGNFNTGSISDSFSGGRTTNGSYLADAQRVGYYNVEGSANAGGLVGIMGGTIANSYTSSSVFGGTKSDDLKNQWSYTTGSVNVGGLVGTTSAQQDNAITNCYTVGMVQGPKNTTGELIGSYGQWSIKNALRGNYYLEGINFDTDTLEELPAVSRPGGLDPNENHDSNYTAVDYYSSNDPIAKKDPSITYITYSYDNGLKGEYPFISYTRQADNSNISVHLGGWQIPVDKSQYRVVRLYNDDKTTLIATKAILAGSSWQPSDYVDTSNLVSSKGSDAGSFVGWTDDNGNVLSAADFTSITQNITAYAKYAKQITFKYVDPTTGKDGGLVANVEFNADGSVTVPTTPSISGYAFDGWYTAIDGGEKITVTDEKISSISTNIYYAHYRQIKTYTYTMVFCYEDENGDIGDEISSLNKIVYERTSDNYSDFTQNVDLSTKGVANATVDQVIEKNTDTDETVSTQKVNSNSVITMTGSAFNKTYYVMYKATPVTYTVHHVFHDSVDNGASISNGALVGKDSNGNDLLVYSKGDLATVDETKTGYVGSTTKASVLDLSNVPGEFEVTSTIEQKNLNNANSNVEITIDYYRKSYTLSYSAPDASNYITPQMIPYGAPVTLVSADQVVRPGYTLNYWTISYDGITLYNATDFKIASMPATDVTAFETASESSDNWSENTTAKVTVQFWQQKPQTKSTYTKDDYDYYGGYSDDVAIGNTYTVDPDIALDTLPLKNSTDFDHFSYSKDETAKYNEITDENHLIVSSDGKVSVTVSADGATTINLYYTRDVITINFNYFSGRTNTHLDKKVTWTGLYGEEFGKNYIWDENYDWYESFSNSKGPDGIRLTFITYFHTENTSSNTMNLYGKKPNYGPFTSTVTVSHYIEKLDGTGVYDETGYDKKNSSTLISSTGWTKRYFNLSEKYPYGFELVGYRYFDTDWYGNKKWNSFISASSGDDVYIDNDFAVFYKRKSYAITLRNADVSAKDGADNTIKQDDGGVYYFTEKYGTSYSTIDSVLDGLTVTKPANSKAAGEEFVGWYLDENCTKPFTGDTGTLDGPLQLFAKWDKCKYHVNFYGSETDTTPLTTIDVSSGNVLYNASTGESMFPEISADEGYEVRWYYLDSSKTEHQYVKDRQIQLDLVSDKNKGSDGYYTINLYARKVAVKPVHLYYELYDRDTAEVIEYNGQTVFTTDDTYSVGSAYTIVAPDLDGYTFVSGNTGVATSDTQENPIRLVYTAKQGSWRHVVESYARYAYIDDADKIPVSVELSSRTINKSDETGYVVDTASTIDGYTFVQSALLTDENETGYAVSDDSQVTVNKDEGSAQVVRFWYAPTFDGSLTNESASYDGNEHGVSYQLNTVPAVGSNNTLVYKYTYSLNNASTATTYVQYAWTNADGTAGIYGNAPVNAGVYSVKVEILLYKDASVNTDELDAGENLLTVYRNSSAGSLTISPASLVITSGSQSWIYGSGADGTGFHTNTDWTATVNGTAVDASSLPVTVTFLDTSKIQQPGTMANEFTVSFKDSASANNYSVSKVYGSLSVVWTYKVKYVLSLPDVVYEAKSDAEKAEAVKNGTDVKPVQIEMYETTVTSDNPYVFDAVKAEDSKPASLDGLKLTNGDTAQKVGYHNGDQTVTYVYTPDFDTASIVKDDALGVYEMKLAKDSDELKKVLSALKPYLADQTPDSDDDTLASDASAYEKYLGTKNSDYRLVYEMTYTLQNSDGSMGSASTVVYQAGEDGTVKDKDGKAAVLSGSVPTVPGTYVVSGRIVLQHRTDVLDKDGNKTGDKWSDANVVYASSDSQNVSAVIGK